MTELVAGRQKIERVEDKVAGSVKPSLLNECYFSTEDMVAHFHIGKRVLQNYRATGVIPYIAIQGIFLYT